MAATMFLLAVLGCADGATDCRPVATLPQAYESAASCEAAIDGALAEHSVADFPTLYGECRAQKGKASLSRPATANARTDS